MGVTVVKDTDKGLQNILKNVKEFKNIVVKVGIQGAEANRRNEGIRVVDYATANEYGTDKIPERSFIRSTVDDNKGFKDEINHAFTSVITGKDTPRSAMAKVGIIARDDIIAKINKGDNRWKPLLEKTIARKKSSKPLIDTGRMKQSITYTFEKKNAN